MDNQQMPPVQQPDPSVAFKAPSVLHEQSAEIALLERRNKTNSLVRTVIAVAFGLTTLIFMALFIYFFVQYEMVQDDVDSQISEAVAEAKDEQALEMEAKFAEREKEPYRDFSGPVDYGELSFKYPKTWSVYIAKDAANGGDFEAYFNPIEVNAVSNNTINALRVIIRNKDFESVAAEYQRAMDKKDSNLSMITTTVGGVVANRYTGKIPSTELNGIIVIFKIRDKTAVLQTDSLLFESDFDTLIKTISFNA